jgi:tetratricopeptide (TPR) repeat protein
MKWSHWAALAGLVLAVVAAHPSVAAPRDDFDTCYRESGDRAIAACTRAIKSGRYKGRDLAILYSNRGSEWTDKEDYDAAMRDHNEAIRIDKNYGPAYSNRGNVWSARGEPDRAIEDYNEAIRINPRDAKALNNRGDEYTLVGKYDLALRDLDRAIRIEPNAVRLSNRCFARAITGALQDALEDCDESLRMRPKSAVVHGRRGLAYLKLNRLETATDDFEAALKINPNQALSLYGRGLIKVRKGDTAAGNEDIDEAKSRREAIVGEYVKYGVVVDSFLKPSAPPARTAAPPVRTPASTPAADCARAESHWKSAEEIKSVAVYEDHLARFGNCEFAVLAKARIEAAKKK